MDSSTAKNDLKGCTIMGEGGSVDRCGKETEAEESPGRKM